MPSRKASTQARKQIQQQVIEQDDDYIDLQQGQLDLQQEYIEEQKEQTGKFICVIHNIYIYIYLFNV